MPQRLKQHPTELFRRNVFVAPFNEDSVPELVSRIGAAQQKIMSSNLKGLLDGARN